MTQAVHIFGIRHHGPGGANALREALASLKPDIILVEGPPDAEDLLSLANHSEMMPPVALLLYEQANPKNACFYPFAIFSPEWQAITYGLKQQIPVRFMDLPIANRFALDAKKQEEKKTESEKKPKSEENETGQNGNSNPDELEREAQSESETDLDPVGDPFLYLARAAGYTDGERFWEHLVEQRTDYREVFQAVMEAMTVLRVEIPPRPDPHQIEARREASMRKILRGAMKEGFGTIAVVCGAWHAPALEPDSMPTATQDTKTLADMPKTKVAAAWIPWTYGRLANASGYGAGIDSPGWYQHLFQQKAQTGLDPSISVIPWFAKIARCLRQKDLDCSSAHIIEATRLAQTLATMRGRVLPGLEEIQEATLGVLTFGDSVPLALIREKLLIGEKMGSVPSDGPIPPLQLDFQKQQKRLRLQADPEQKTIELDLRKPNDLERSQLLHRMALLSIPWGKPPNGYGGRTKGTFKEPWQIQWLPDFAIALIEAGILGNTIYDAATGKARQNAIQAKDLPTLTQLLDTVLLGDLPEAIRFLMHRLESLAAVATDLQKMMQALPPMANILRYGNVRKTDSSLIEHVAFSLSTRITVGLPFACQSLNDDAATEWDQLLGPTHSALKLMNSQKDDSSENSVWKPWVEMLDNIANRSSTHGLLSGHMTRICFDEGQISAVEAGNRMSLALSQGEDPAHGARWVEGFLKGSGLVLLHDRSLWEILDQWIGALTLDGFTSALPLLRRTFSLFPSGERRQMGQRVKTSGTVKTSHSGSAKEIDETRGAKVFPLLETIFGLK